MSFAALRSRLGTVVGDMTQIVQIDGPNQRGNVEENIPPTFDRNAPATYAKWTIGEAQRRQRDFGGGETFTGQLVLWVWIQQARTDRDSMTLAEHIWDTCRAAIAGDLNFDNLDLGDEGFANGYYGRRVSIEFTFITG